jgi:mannosyltransferase OCH1-like enzyme
MELFRSAKIAGATTDGDEQLAAELKKDAPAVEEAQNSAAAGAANATAHLQHGDEQTPESAADLADNWDICAEPSPVTEPMKIPKILHQTYMNASLPAKFSEWRNSWLKHFPVADGWKHFLWLDADNDAFIKENYPWFWETYSNYDEKIKKIDSVRAFLLYHYGGIYADLDMEVLKDPTSLFNGDTDMAFFYLQPNPRVGDDVLGNIPNALMASTKGHPFWMFLAHQFKEHAGEYVFQATGPDITTSSLQKYRAQHRDAKVKIYPSKYWSPSLYGTPEIFACLEKDCSSEWPGALLLNHWTGSWGNWNGHPLTSTSFRERDNMAKTRDDC